MYSINILNTGQNPVYMFFSIIRAPKCLELGVNFCVLCPLLILQCINYSQEHRIVWVGSDL